MSKMVECRIVQSRHCPAIMAAFFGDVGVKLTMSGEAPWGAVAEDPPGARFNANWQNWEDIPDERAPEAQEALKAVFGPASFTETRPA